MSHSSKLPPRDTSFGSDLLYAVRYYATRRFGLVAIAGVAVAAGFALDWNWLVATGIIPVLLTALPCLVMCGLGVCLHLRAANARSAARSGPVGVSERLEPPEERGASLREPAAGCCDAAAETARERETLSATHDQSTVRR